MSFDFPKMNKSHHDQGIQRTKIPIDAGGSFTGSQDLVLDYSMRELLIANDGTDSLTITVSGANGYVINFTLLAGDVLDERFYPFNEINVVATGDWRYIVRSGVIA